MGIIDEDIYYEMKKSNKFMWMIFGALLVIAGTLIATLPYISSYTKGSVEMQSAGGTYVLISPFFLIFGIILTVIGFGIIIDGFFGYLWLSERPRPIEREQAISGYRYLQYPFSRQECAQNPAEHTSPQRYYYPQESPPIQQSRTRPQPHLKKKKVKTTPDGRPIYRKKKPKRDI